MYENFLKIDEDKRNRIINAAFEVFAKNDYKRASTLAITEKAQISKGALFHYFGNKHNLYLYLYDIGVDLLMKEMNLDRVMNNADFFSRLEDAAKTKMLAMYKHPFLSAFFVKVYIEEDESVQKELSLRLQELMKDSFVFYDNIDVSKFRKQVDLRLLTNLIVNFSAEFLQAELFNNADIDMEEIMKQFQVYLTMLKENFYKEEFL